MSTLAPQTASESAPRLSICLHCGLPLARGDRSKFCCRGCEAVYALLHDEGLARYYDLRRGVGASVTQTGSSKDQKWLEPIAARIAQSQSPVRETLDVQGIHCAGCVWLIDELFRREPGANRIEVNPSTGRIQIVVGSNFEIVRWADRVEQFGYRFGPADRVENGQANSLLMRMGICIALAMNSMIFAIAIYAGLRDPTLLRLFQTINLALSVSPLHAASSAGAISQSGCA